MNVWNKGFMAALIALGLLFSACSGETTSTANVEEKVEEVVANELVSQVVELNNDNTTISWVGKKVTGQHNGTIGILSGSIIINDGIPTEGKVVIDMNDLVVLDIEDEEQNGNLTGHLKSDDFFGVAKFPEAYLSISGADDNSMGGELTIKGISQGVKGPYTVGAKSISGSFTIDRTVYDIKYGSGKFFEDLGDKMINDEFEISYEISL